MVEADIDVPKGQVRPRPASRFPLPLHLWLSQLSSCYSNQEHFPSIELPPPDSMIVVDLEAVFRVGLQNTLFEAYTRSLGSLKTRAAMMKRPGCGHDLMSG